LIGHDEKGDVLGRVLEARYVDESWKYAGDFPVVKDFIFYNRDAKKRQNLFHSVDWIVDNLMPLEDYMGLGYTELGLRVTNPDAIRKVLADEYLTVSVGFKTDSAVCSLCHTDWAVDGKCEHKLGEIDEDRQMFLISGSFVNEEISFINFPADPFATTLSKKTLTDSLEKMFFLGLPLKQQKPVVDGMRMTDGLIYELDLSVTEEPNSRDTMIDIATLDLTLVRDEIKAPELTKDRAQELKQGFDQWKPETDELKTTKRSLVSNLNAKIRKQGWDKENSKVEDSEVALELAQFIEDGKKKKKKVESEEKSKEFQQSESDSNKDCDCDIWDDWEPESEDDKQFFADVDGIDAELELELQAAVKDGELPADLTIDAVLSTEARNKLAKDAFCGPNRSFPVKDCAHVTAARRLLGRAKVSADTKKKISACVDRKAKTLKCSVSAKKKDEAEVSAPNTGVTTDSLTERAVRIVDYVLKDAVGDKVLSADDRASVVKIVSDLDKAYDSISEGDSAKYQLRWAIRAMLDDWSADDSVKWALKALEGNTDHVVSTRNELDEKEEALNGLVSERDSLVKEVSLLKESRAAVLSASKRILAQQIVMNGVLTGQDAYKGVSGEVLEQKVDELSKRHITSLKDSVHDIHVGLQWIKPAHTDSTKSTEASETVDDNIRVTDEVSVATTDAKQAEADQARDTLLLKLRYMAPLEARRYLGQMKFESSNSK
jgi:hypothetical protein